MPFFDEFYLDRFNLAFDRTRRNFESACDFAYNQPVEASLLLGGAITLGCFFPGPVLLMVCLSALALICINLFKEPTLAETASSIFKK